MFNSHFSLKGNSFFFFRNKGKFVIFFISVEKDTYSDSLKINTYCNNEIRNRTRTEIYFAGDRSMKFVKSIGG